jgi:hypothetical protein
MAGRLIGKFFFNELKCMVLHLGTLRQLESKYKYYINGIEVTETFAEKDLGQWSFEMGEAYC